MFSLTRLLSSGPTSFPNTLNNLEEPIIERNLHLQAMKRVSHWIVHYMDPPEPKWESATKKAVDAHHHVHVEIPGARQTLKC